MIQSRTSERTKNAWNKAKDSIDRPSPTPEEKLPERINKMLAATSNLGQGSYGMVADSRKVTGQANTTVTTEGEPNGPAVGVLAAQSQVNDEQIHVFSKAGPPEAFSKEVNNGKVDNARRPRDGKKGNSKTNFGPATGVGAESITAGTVNSSVVQNAYHLMESSTKVKDFCTAEAESQTFVGRGAELELIHKKLQENCATQEHHMRRIVALVSTPGLGKTEIARAFVRKYKDQYEPVVWIDASRDSTARASFVHLAKLLKFDHAKENKGKDLARLVYPEISDQSEKPPLFIFDGAERLKTDGKLFGIQDYLPTQLKKNLPLILITSRSDEWSKLHCEVIEVTPLTKEESLQFFSTALGLSTKQQKDSKLKELLEELAEKLEGHPVRLEKAQKFISSIPDPETASTSSKKSISPAKPSLAQLKEKVRECIEKADGREFSAEIPENSEQVEELSAQESEATLNSGGLSADSKDMDNAMAEPRHNAGSTPKCEETLGKTMERRVSSPHVLHDIEFSETQKAVKEEELIFLREEKPGEMKVSQASQDEPISKLAEKTSVLRVQNELQKILASHDAQMDSKLENVYDADAVEVIQNELTDDALKEMQDFLGELRGKLQRRDRWLAQVKANRERLAKEISAFMFQTERDFKRALDPPKFCSEDEMGQTELESRAKAMEEHDKFSAKVPETQMSSLRTHLIARLDDISEKARKQVKKNAEAMEERLDNTITEAVAKYKRSMVRFLSSEIRAIRIEERSAWPSLPSTSYEAEEDFTIEKMPPVPSEDLQEFHGKSEAKASKFLRKFLDKNTQKIKIPTQMAEKSRETLEDSISDGFSHFQRLHQKKMESVKAEALKEITKAEQEFTTEMKKLLESAKDEEHFDLEATMYKGQAKSRLEASLIAASITDKIIFPEILSEWDSKVEQLLNHYKISMKKQYEEKIENFKARNNASKVKEEFRAEIDKLLVTMRQAFDSQASNLQNQLTTKLQNSMDLSKIGMQSAEDVMSAWDGEAQELLSKVTAWNSVQPRSESAKAPAYRDVAKVEPSFRADMFAWGPPVLQNSLKKDLENSMDVASMGQHNGQEIMSTWDSTAAVVKPSTYNPPLGKPSEQRVETDPSQAIESVTDAQGIEHNPQGIEHKPQVQGIENVTQVQET